MRPSKYQKFSADVSYTAQLASQGKIPCVTSTLRGPSDWEVIFEYKHPVYLQEPIRMQAVAQDIATYPSGNEFLLFSDSPNTPQLVADSLLAAQSAVIGYAIPDMVSAVAAFLSKTLASGHACRTDESTTIRSQSHRRECGDEQAQDHKNVIGEENHYENEDDNSDFNNMDFENDNDDDSSDDNEVLDAEIFGLQDIYPNPKPFVNTTSQTVRTGGEYPTRLREDLGKVKEIGFEVSVLHGLDMQSPAGCRGGTIAISIPLGHLGLSEPIRRDLGVHGHEYVVLLLRYEHDYHPLESLVKGQLISEDVHIRAGICGQPEPAIEGTHFAFRQRILLGQFDMLSNASPTEDIPGNKGTNKFRLTLITNALHDFMGQHFNSILDLKLATECSWDEVLERFRSATEPTIDTEDRQGALETLTAGRFSITEAKEIAGQSQIRDGSSRLEKHLVKGTSSPVDEQLSFPLLAAEFASYYLRNCTSFCLVCHGQIEPSQEDGRTYVCSDPLCSFQYGTWGQGIKVKNDIIYRPSVVDLLTSLCYASNADGRRFPDQPLLSRSELPVGIQLLVPNLWTKFEVNAGVAPIRVKVIGKDQTLVVRQREFIRRLPVNQWVAIRSSLPGPDGIRQLTFDGVVTATDDIQGSFEVQVIPAVSSGNKKGSSSSVSPDVELWNASEAVVYPYDIEFDSLTEAHKSEALRHVLDTLPPIKDIQSYLMSEPQASLSSCPLVSPTASKLLQWIVAVNRYSIQEIGPDRREYVRGRELGAWKQFRLVRHTVEHEAQFKEAVERETAREWPTDHRTIFAWHGSPTRNWHSILRTGLNFRIESRGRAYGDGVYFSRDFDVSKGYCESASAAWPNSALRISHVLGLNELVNARPKFVSAYPHYVINRLEWQECRYLFVLPSLSVAAASHSSQNCTGLLEPMIKQVPGFELRGPRATGIDIPVLISAWRTLSSKQSRRVPSRKRALELGLNDGDNSRSGVVNDMTKKIQPPSDLPHLDVPKTDFRPGTLDLKSLPCLRPPTWGTTIALRILARELKAVERVQSTTPLHELGWYVHCDETTNLFHWIVELHSFDTSLPLAQDLRSAGMTSVVLEVRFGRSFPTTPPFIRVIRPRFLPFLAGGGGHVTAGGALCMELLTNSGWSPANSLESVLVQVRLAICGTQPAARLARSFAGGILGATPDYGVQEAVEAYRRAARVHGWAIPPDLDDTVGMEEDGQRDRS